MEQAKLMRLTNWYLLRRISQMTAQILCVYNHSVIFSLDILNLHRDSLLFRGGSKFSFKGQLETHRKSQETEVEWSRNRSKVVCNVPSLCCSAFDKTYL